MNEKKRRASARDSLEAARPPAPTTEDRVHTAVKLGISGIPLIGGIAAEIFNNLIAPPVEQRRDSFLASLARRVTYLERRGLNQHSLRDNPAFIDAVLFAADVWVRQSDEEKRSAMLNAVTNSALPEAPGAVEQAILLRMIRDLTPAHLRFLKFAENPAEWFHDLRGGTPGPNKRFLVWIQEALPEFESMPLLEVVVADLRALGFFGSKPLPDYYHPHPRPVELHGFARVLLRFVESPPDLEETVSES